MPKFVTPNVYFTGATEARKSEVERYLRDTGQTEFLRDWEAAEKAGIPSGMILCSMYAKMCYKTLVPGKNLNVKKVREVHDNLIGTFEQGHGSVFEHCSLNFVATNVSRVFTHELVRHRAGTAFSQTSGRYCRLEDIEVVLDPALDPVKDLFASTVRTVEDTVYLAECRLGLRKPNPANPAGKPDEYFKALDCVRRGVIPADRAEDWKWVPDDSFDFDRRKKLTSAIRRIAPNGQANEIGFTLNVRTLRHIVELRTARFAEWEIRDVFNQVYSLVKAEWPVLFHGAKEREVDGLTEVYGMKHQPYQLASA